MLPFIFFHEVCFDSLHCHLPCSKDYICPGVPIGKSVLTRIFHLDFPTYCIQTWVYSGWFDVCLSFQPKYWVETLVNRMKHFVWRRWEEKVKFLSSTFKQNDLILMEIQWKIHSPIWEDVGLNHGKCLKWRKVTF